MGTLKSGWVEKQQDGVLRKNWKKKHAVLYNDGEFSLYDKITDSTAETQVNMTIECKRIEAGFELDVSNLPKNRNDTDSLFAVITNDKSLILLSQSPSDCREWVAALENARNLVQISSKGPMAPRLPDAPPAYSPMAYSQPLRANNQSNGSTPMAIPPPQMQQNQYNPRQPMGQPMYGGQPGYNPPPQPMYRQPMYGQPVYYSQPVQQAPQRSSGLSNTGGLLLAGGGGLLGGYMLGSMMTDLNYHHNSDNYDHGSNYDHGGGDFDDGGFDF